MAVALRWPQVGGQETAGVDDDSIDGDGWIDLKILRVWYPGVVT